MSNYPLHFYYRFFETRPIVKLNHLADYYEFLTICTINLPEDLNFNTGEWTYKDYGILQDQSIPETYKIGNNADLIRFVANEEKAEANRLIDEFVESNSLQDCFLYLVKQVDKIDYYIKLYDKGYKEYTILSPIKESLQSLKLSITEKYPRFFNETEFQKTKNKLAELNTRGIIWNGSAALLASLFKQLMEVKAPISSKPLLEANFKEIDQLAEKCFIDGDTGGYFNAGSVEKYLKQRESKRYKIKISVVQSDSKKEEKTI